MSGNTPMISKANSEQLPRTVAPKLDVIVADDNPFGAKISMTSPEFTPNAPLNAIK